MTSTIAPGQYRLATLQVYNWGTFNGLHTVDVARAGFLIFGPSGSGKSTLIDAVSTILGSPGRHRFNAAATESGKKSGRDLVTYCRGAWQKEHDADLDDVTRSFLRPGPMWSGVGLHFSDDDGGEITALRIMCLTANTTTQSEVKNLFLLLPGKVSLVDCEELGKHSAGQADAKKQFPDLIAINRNLSPFSAALRKRLGIADEKAIELLQRTQSAKTLGDLNQLMRDFMLPEPATFKIADDAAENFTELKTAHATVVTARNQINKLRPIRDSADKHAELTKRIRDYTMDLDAVPVYANTQRLGFARSDLRTNQGERDDAQASLETVQEKAAELAERVTNLHVAIRGEKDDGITAAEHRRDKLRDECARVENEAKKFFTVLTELTPFQPASQEDFINLRVQLEEEIADIEARQQTYGDTRTDIYSRLSILKQAIDQGEKDIRMAEKFRSNMDPRLLRARERICEITGIARGSLPFVADLIHIDPAFAQWQPAAERVMGGFARMLLVPDEFYPQVAAAVDATHLGTKLTYQDIDAKLESLRPQAISARSLAATIVVEHGRYEGWIQHQLSTRFDHVRAESIEEFRSHRRAVTKAGQLRDGSRHVKDDRSRIDDRSRWVLFENSDARIDVLTAQQRQRKNELNAVAEEQKQFESKAKADAARIVSARRALETEKFAQIDVSAAQNLLDEAQKDLDALVDNNDRLAELQAELRTALGLTNLQETEKANLQQRIGVARDRVSEATATIERLTSQLAGAEPLPPEVERRIAGRMKAYARAINASNIDAATIEVERKIRADKSAAEGQCSNLHNSIKLAMNRYLDAWPERQGDLTPEVEALGDFLAELQRLEDDDLPRFESNFRELLFDQTNTHLGRLRRELATAASSIRKEIDRLNESLTLVDFYPGRTLQIEVRESQPAEARDFARKLAAAVDGTLENDEGAAEQRFERLSAVIEDLVESDTTTARQRKLRLDTRWHVAFYGVEVDADGNRGAVYDSAEGLSGGQAQKLSSFCLAAALRFRLTGMGEPPAKAKKSRVVIGEDVYPHYGTIILDEAFDRADAEFTRTSMEVFDRFGFHMVLATPEKLLQPVEDYIGGVLMVDCPDRKHSRTSALTIEEAENHAVG